MTFFKIKDFLQKNKKTNNNFNKKSLDKQLNNNKESKILSIKPYKACRALLWSLIVIILVRGVGTLIRGSEAHKIYIQNKAFLESLNQESGLEVKAFSFAESFVREYFTRYPTNKDDFKNRILKFTTEQLANDMNNNSYSEIINVSAFSFEKYSENQFNVGVEAKVKQYIPKPNQDSIPLEQLEYDTNLVNLCIDVPIYISDSLNMIVDGLPVFISGKEKAKFNTIKVNKEVENNSEIVTKVTDSVTQFFKAYYEQDQTQINYFLENNSDPIEKPLGDSKFERIDTMSLYNLQNNQYLAVVNLTINSYGNDLKQGFNLTLVKNGDKYLIKDLNSRTTNLNIK